jgi:zinc protease
VEAGYGGEHLRSKALRKFYVWAVVLAVALAAAGAGVSADAQSSKHASGGRVADTNAHSWKVPTAMKKFDNGLIVVASEDHTSPTFGICISYGIGYRLEPQGRSGFAHLFEHFMFQGTPNAPKGIFTSVIDEGGGSFNGATRADFTEYIDSAPISALDPVLWLEADRMKTLDFSTTNLDNQRNVVKEEARSTMQNQPYALFYAVDLPMKAFDTFPNNHSIIGDFKDLDAASIPDVKAFYESYYSPNNAVLAITGDFSADEIFASAEKYFGGIAARKTPAKPDVSEPAQTAERTSTQEDKLAPSPALAIGYRMPPRKSAEAITAAVVAELLYRGDASILYQTLVQEKKVATSVNGGVNWPLGNQFEYNGPTLLAAFIVYPNEVKEADLLGAYDSAVQKLATNGPSADELERAITKVRLDWYGELEIPVERAEVISLATLFDGNPGMVNEIGDDLGRVTAVDVKAFVAKYLAKTNETIINRVPAAKEKAGAGGGSGGKENQKENR